MLMREKIPENGFKRHIPKSEPLLRRINFKHVLNIFYIRDLDSSGTSHTFEPFFFLKFSFFYCF